MELLKTKGVPIVTIKEKLSYLGAHADQRSVELIETLDTVSQYIGITHSFDRDMFIGLIEKLKELLTSTLGEKQENRLVEKAVKRCLRKILSIMSPNAPLGNPYNYETIKDSMLAKAISSRVN